MAIGNKKSDFIRQAEKILSGLGKANRDFERKSGKITVSLGKDLKKLDKKVKSRSGDLRKLEKKNIGDIDRAFLEYIAALEE